MVDSCPGRQTDRWMCSLQWERKVEGMELQLGDPWPTVARDEVPTQ